MRRQMHVLKLYLAPTNLLDLDLLHVPEMLALFLPLFDPDSAPGFIYAIAAKTSGRYNNEYYPIVWCGAITSMHRHSYAHCEKTHTRLWHKAYGYNMKRTSSSDSIPSRVLEGLSGYALEKIVPLGIRPWDTRPTSNFY